MAPRGGALYRTNGTVVPDDITFRPFSITFDVIGLAVLEAGHFSQIVVTRTYLTNSATGWGHAGAVLILEERPGLRPSRTAFSLGQLRLLDLDTNGSYCI
jgi:hypothetical protein